MNLQAGFLQRMRLAHKFALLGLVAGITVAVPLYGAYQEKQANLAFTEGEVKGLPPIGATLEMIRGVQDHRQASSYVLIGQSKSEPDVTKNAAATDAALANLDALLGGIDSPSLQTKWSAIKADWKKVKEDAASRRVEQRTSSVEHAALIARLIGLIGELTAHTQLDLDPTAEGYYMIQAALIELPRLSELLGQLRSPVVSRLREIERLRNETKPGTTPDYGQAFNATDRTRIGATVAGIEATTQRFKWAVERLAAVSPETKASAQPLLVSVEREIDTALELVRREVLNKELPTIAASAYLAEVSKPREAVRNLAVTPEALVKSLESRFDAQQRSLRLLGFQTAGLLLLVAFVALMIVRSITAPVNALIATVRRVEEGDESARAAMSGKDEISLLGQAFDKMVDVRVAVQQRIQHENETLNGSVLGLLQAVAQLSRKDLTIKVPVTEDVTGPVADALNLLTGETAKVLQQVSDISADVTSASIKVQKQADSVMSAANAEREQVEQTAASLEDASRTMTQIAALAQQCNSAADRAIATTQQALETVNSTVGGINSTRDTIRETEKRIKRLGERSQEISVAVNLINTIAERTHILALNAAMHAASAGEAGRGFAVVADEVQRLAESARQSTQQIAGLVSNIQVETADTVTAMNSAITQVVDGARLAEQAGRQMQVTQQTTAELVASVQHIATQSQQQARSSQVLLERAGQIKRSTQQTNEQLTEQSQQTRLLVDYARSLLSAVRVFKLSAT